MTGSTPFEEEAAARRRRSTKCCGSSARKNRRKPSTRLSSSDTLPSIAANRHTEPARLSKEVRGELDWIVMKCLEKDRNRRYETCERPLRRICSATSSTSR